MVLLERDKKVKWVLFAMIFVALATASYVTARRYMFERTNKQVEMVMSYREIGRMAQLDGMDQKELLKYLKEKSGLTSIVVEEETLADFVQSGRITLLKGSDIINLYRIGHINKYIMTHLYSKTNVRPDGYYIIVDIEKDYDRIKDFLNAEFDKENVKKIGRWNIIEVVDEGEDLLQVGIGISEDLVKELQGMGFSVIIRTRNSNRLNEGLMLRKFNNISKLENVKTVIFEGESVLGYPTQMELLKRKISEHGLNIGMIEFSKQEGMQSLASEYPESVLRVHSISDSAMETIDFNRAVARYVRAARERGGKILYLHPFFNRYRGRNIVDLNIDFIQSVHASLEAQGFQVQPIIKLMEKGDYKEVHWFELFLLSLGILSVFLLTVDYFIRLNILKLFLSYGVLGLLFYLCLLFEKIAVWNDLMVVLAAVLFPTIAIIANFPSKVKLKTVENRYAASVLYLIKMLGVSVVGALFIVACRSKLVYIFGINQFFGVKIAFVMPLLIIGLYFFLRPHRIPAMFHVFKRLLYSPIRTSSMVAVLFCIGFVAIYVLRSGNYISFHIPGIETNIRHWLESLFFVRPRTKEFLIGYPFLLFTFLYIDKGIERRWLWFFNVMGVVALISVVNSFCHFHTPLLVTAYRTILGCLLGYLIGLAYVIGFKIIKIIVRRIV